MLKKINPLFPILLAALVLRLFFLFKSGAFFWDEIFSVTYSQKPWLQSIKFWTWETNPFLHMLILKIWFYIFSPNEITARLPSIIFGVAGVWALFRFGATFFNKRIAAIAAILLALTPYHILFSCTARGYALLILLAIINVHYFLLLFMKRENKKSNVIIFSASLLLLLFTHLTFAWVILSELIILLTFEKKDAIIIYIKYCVIPFILWLIWAIPSIYLKLSNPMFFGNSWFFLIKNTFIIKMDALQALFFGPAALFPVLALILGFFTIAGYTIYKQIKNKKGDRMLYIVGIFFLMPLLATVFLNLWSIKFIIIGLPWMLIIFAYLLNLYLTDILFVAIFISLLVAPGLARLNAALPLSDWQAINDCVSRHKKADARQIFIYDPFIFKILFDRYYNATVPTLGYFPYQDYENWDQKTIKTNYLMYKHPKEEILAWMDEQKLTDYDEIFVMQESGKEKKEIAVDITSVLEEKKYILTDQCDTRLADGGKAIYYYVKTEKKK